MPDTDFDGISDIFKLKNKLYFPLILLLLLQLLKLYFDCKNSKKGGMAFFPFFWGGGGGETPIWSPGHRNNKTKKLPNINSKQDYEHKMNICMLE